MLRKLAVIMILSSSAALASEGKPTDKQAIAMGATSVVSSTGAMGCAYRPSLILPAIVSVVTRVATSPVTPYAAFGCLAYSFYNKKSTSKKA